MRQIEERNLPTANPADLRKINIQLARRGLKLDVFKQIRTPAAVIGYKWDHLQEDIKYLLGLALAKYPALRPEHQSQAIGVMPMGPEALRGLAVAASEIQQQNASSSIYPPATANLVSQSPAQLDHSHARSIPSNVDGAPQSASHANPPSQPPSQVSMTLPPSNQRPGSEIDTSSNMTNMPIDQTPVISPTPGTQVDIPHRDQATQPEGLHADKNAVSPPPQPIEGQSNASLSPQASTSLTGNQPWIRNAPTLPASLKSLRYSVFVMLTTGLQKVSDSAAWEAAKSSLASSVWAEGRVSVVVEIE